MLAKVERRLMTMPTHPTAWSLIDQYESVDDANPISPVSIQSEEHLRSLLEQARRGNPRLLFLSHAAGHRLLVGIGGPLAGILYYDNPHAVDGKFALPHQQHSLEPEEFVSEDAPMGFPARVLMPPEDVISITCEFVRTDRLPRSVQWVLARTIPL
jgi:hypothetical protein